MEEGLEARGAAAYEYAKALRDAFERSGKTQAEFATFAHVSPPTVTRYLKTEGKDPRVAPAEFVASLEAFLRASGKPPLTADELEDLHELRRKAQQESTVSRQNAYLREALKESEAKVENLQRRLGLMEVRHALVARRDAALLTAGRESDAEALNALRERVREAEAERDTLRTLAQDQERQLGAAADYARDVTADLDRTQEENRDLERRLRDLASRNRVLQEQVNLLLGKLATTAEQERDESEQPQVRVKVGAVSDPETDLQEFWRGFVGGGAPGPAGTPTGPPPTDSDEPVESGAQGGEDDRPAPSPRVGTGWSAWRSRVRFRRSRRQWTQAPDDNPWAIHTSLVDRRVRADRRKGHWSVLALLLVLGGLVGVLFGVEQVWQVRQDINLSAPSRPCTATEQAGTGACFQLESGTVTDKHSADSDSGDALWVKRASGKTDIYEVNDSVLNAARIGSTADLKIYQGKVVALGVGGKETSIRQDLEFWDIWKLIVIVLGALMIQAGILARKSARPGSGFLFEFVFLMILTAIAGGITVSSGVVGVIFAAILWVTVTAFVLHAFIEEARDRW
ncbi:hypothetical protein [Kitasatospora sp. LaBMicrA B282]|uniref:hypothetical protein n=1 Tax=Kitasatospora sp. LaBMicrA B282 TaxID=3420949 RepID=UPI003D147315